MDMKFFEEAEAKIPKGRVYAYWKSPHSALYLYDSKAQRRRFHPPH